MKRQAGGETMQPARDSNSTLVDLLDRLLDKGMILNIDLIIGVAGIPLIGISLRAALAAMETMLEYGLMEDWDTRIREQAMAVPELMGQLPSGGSQK